MTQIVLYVATPLTGAAQVQSALTARRAELAGAGVLYPDLSAFVGGRRDAHHDLARRLAQDDAASRSAVACAMDWLRQRAAGFDTVILCAEPFFWLTLAASGDQAPTPEARRRYLDRLAQALDWGDVAVTLALGDPVAHAQTAYARHVVNTSGTEGFDTFVSRHAQRFDYRFQIDAWRARFAQTDILGMAGIAPRDLVARVFTAHAPAVTPPDGSTAQTRTLTPTLCPPPPAATLWLLHEKRAAATLAPALRDRWHFAHLPEGRALFSGAGSFFPDAESQAAFHHRIAATVREAALPAPAPHAPTQWTSTRHAQAEAAWRAWADRHQPYLSARRSLGLAPHATLPARASTDGLTAPQIVAASRNAGILPLAVCVITRNRERMLGDLLDSFVTLQMPERTAPFFVVVENNDRPAMTARVDRFRAANGGFPVHLVLEPDLGIPIARNTAVTTALTAGAEAVVFVDDDEVVTPDWLTRLVARYRNSDLMLVGGPVDARFDGPPRSAFEGKLRNGITHRYRHKNRKSDRQHQRGREGGITIATNNWLADARLFTLHGLRFDVAMRYTGGSDAEFSQQVRQRGLPSGWARDATVIETVPSERVAMGYQFRRAMEQSRNSLDLSLRRRGRVRAVVSILSVLLLRIVSLLPLLMALPLTGGAGLITLARNAGWIAGRLSGFFGARSALYRKITGY